jgi:metal-sulfur cluster biosynthetic enzyme
MEKDLKEKIKSNLTKVTDPELKVNVVDLGLIYDIYEKEGTIIIKMTLTSPICPYGKTLLEQVKKCSDEIVGEGKTQIKLVWTPRWDPRTMATEEAKFKLGII